MTNLANSRTLTTTTTTTTTTESGATTRARAAATTTTLGASSAGLRLPSISHLPSSPSPSRQRSRSRTPDYWHLPTPNLQALEPAIEWGSDPVNQNLSFPLDAAGAGSAPNNNNNPPSPPTLLLSDQNLLNFLAGNEFSSPSSYPSLTSLLPRPAGLDPSLFERPRPRPGFRASSSAVGVASPTSLPRIHQPALYGDNTSLPTSRTNNQHILSPIFDASDSLDTSQYTTLSNDILHDDEVAILPATPDTITSDTMPSTRVRTAAAAAAAAHSSSDGLPRAKRRRTSHASDIRRSPRYSRAAAPPIAANGGQNEPSLFCDTDDDLFGESPTTQPDGLDLRAEELTTIDLTEATEVPEELKKPDVDKRIKLGAFQCVICMDDVSTLTVTHCGHLYCAQCLHSSLNVEATRGKCPMCRTKIDMKPREAYTSKTKGFWPLELKLMTATRKGKRKAGAS